MFRHVTITIRNQHRGLVLVEPYLDIKRGRCQTPPGIAIHAGGEDMNCVFRSGVLGGTGIKGCLVYQLMPHSSSHTLSVDQRIFLVIAWDVHALLGDTKTGDSTEGSQRNRLRAYLFTIHRPNFPQDRIERDRFFHTVYSELSSNADGYRAAQWSGKLGDEVFGCRMKPLLNNVGQRQMITGMMVEFRQISPSQNRYQAPIYLPEESFV
jgi:hypothetical protein